MVNSPDGPPIHPAPPTEERTTIVGGDNPRCQDTDQALETDLGFLQPPGRSGSLGRLGHYEVLAFLGRGAFGIVFRAFDTVLERVVAIKVLAPEIAATSAARKRFLREARTAAQ